MFEIHKNCYLTTVKASVILWLSQFIAVRLSRFGGTVMNWVFFIGCTVVVMAVISGALPLPFCAGIGESIADHLDVIAPIHPNLFSTFTKDAVVSLPQGVVTRDPILITTQHLPLADLVIFPQFAFARRTFDG